MTEEEIKKMQAEIEALKNENAKLKEKPSDTDETKKPKENFTNEQLEQLAKLMGKQSAPKKERKYV